jgi:hypothetical protein
MLRPYSSRTNLFFRIQYPDYSVDVIWHHHEGVGPGSGKVFGNRLPRFINDISDFPPLEQQFLLARANRDEVGSCRTVVVVRKANGVPTTRFAQASLPEFGLCLHGLLRQRDAQVGVGVAGGHAAARGALEEADLHQVRLVDVHDRVGLL